MKTLIKSLVILSALISSAAFATGPSVWTNVTVSLVQACSSENCASNGYVEIELSSAPTSGGPTCGSGNNHWVAIDVTQPGGTFAAQLLETARLSGATVSVGGMGSCTVNSAMDTLATASY